ncbi:hypothetical protein KCU93_g74, partial [Aureobasidium melanogenum]
MLSRRLRMIRPLLSASHVSPQSTRSDASTALSAPSIWNRTWPLLLVRSEATCTTSTSRTLRASIRHSASVSVLWGSKPARAVNPAPPTRSAIMCFIGAFTFLSQYSRQSSSSRHTRGCEEAETDDDDLGLLLLNLESAKDPMNLLTLRQSLLKLLPRFQARCGAIQKISQSSRLSLDNLDRPCEQATLYDLSWGIEDRCGLKEDGNSKGRSNETAYWLHRTDWHIETWMRKLKKWQAVCESTTEQNKPNKDRRCNIMIKAMPCGYSRLKLYLFAKMVDILSQLRFFRIEIRSWLDGLSVNLFYNVPSCSMSAGL